MNKSDTIIISDIHLGSPLSRAKLLLSVIKEWKFNRLIILGDLVANSDFCRFSQVEWLLLKLIGKYVDDGVEVIWVEGNHDIGMTLPLGNILGVKTVEKFEWIWNDNKCIAIHGHQYDNMVGGHFSKFISWIYLELLLWRWFKKHFGEGLSILCRKWQRIVPNVARGCFDLAEKTDSDFVFAGHTHLHEIKKKDNMTYINTGSWVELKSTMIAMMESGLEILEYENK
jgi:UDP-2,3-diacylglucosamine pyrophosphatase LpxH